MRKTLPDPTRPALTEAQAAQLRALEGRGIDTAAILEAPAAHWREAERGRFFRPRKEAISVRLDADVLDWLRRRGPGYQTEINRILRERMEMQVQEPAG
ncbi:MAG TPA: BrnA antitoxin family protein [Acetobacteraceae bacterium]|nr:BrnA antitoxin family protein [Acetobacteraceae bacterium]